MKFASIDIGSNAIRLLLAKVFETENELYIKKESLIRMPLRLGDDVFLRQMIPDIKVNQLAKILRAFRYLIEAYDPINYIACATSAMREANNSPSVIKYISSESGLKLNIIDGKQEARIIFLTHRAQNLKKNQAYLFIDVGGGSTELTLMHQERTIEQQSFDIGTIRLLNQLVSEPRWKEMKSWVRQYCLQFESIFAVGSGGNINKIFRLSAKKERKPLSIKNLQKIYQTIESFTFEERITRLGLRPDRADVILPATRIFTSIMHWGKIKKIYVPQIGLADGLIHQLYEQYKKQTKD